MATADGPTSNTTATDDAASTSKTTIAGGSNAPAASQSKVVALPAVPRILGEDPFFALSELSDTELDAIDRFPQGGTQGGASQGQCSIYGG